MSVNTIHGISPSLPVLDTPTLQTYLPRYTSPSPIPHPTPSLTRSPAHPQTVRSDPATGILQYIWYLFPAKWTDAMWIKYGALLSAYIPFLCWRTYIFFPQYPNYDLSWSWQLCQSSGVQVWNYEEDFFIISILIGCYRQNGLKRVMKRNKVIDHFRLFKHPHVMLEEVRMKLILISHIKFHTSAVDLAFSHNNRSLSTDAVLYIHINWWNHHFHICLPLTFVLCLLSPTASLPRFLSIVLPPTIQV